MWPRRIDYTSGARIAVLFRLIYCSCVRWRVACAECQIVFDWVPSPNVSFFAVGGNRILSCVVLQLRLFINNGAANDCVLWRYGCPNFACKWLGCMVGWRWCIQCISDLTGVACWHLSSLVSFRVKSQCPCLAFVCFLCWVGCVCRCCVVMQSDLCLPHWLLVCSLVSEGCVQLLGCVSVGCKFVQLQM